jgi:CRISPR/Cas system-associated protein Csx1
MQMMTLKFSVAYMIITGFLTHYYVMSNVMTNDLANITNNISKVYLSCVMSSIMGILEVLMFDIHNKTISYKYYLPLFLYFIGSLWLYRKQISVNETNYLKEMIEHHDMALFTSKNILDKPNISEKVRRFATKIVNTQTNEIQEMNQLIQEQIQEGKI